MTGTTKLLAGKPGLKGWVLDTLQDWEPNLRVKIDALEEAIRGLDLDGLALKAAGEAIALAIGDPDNGLAWYFKFEDGDESPLCVNIEFPFSSERDGGFTMLSVDLEAEIKQYLEFREDEQPEEDVAGLRDRFSRMAALCDDFLKAKK